MPACGVIHTRTRLQVLVESQSHGSVAKPGPSVSRFKTAIYNEVLARSRRGGVRDSDIAGLCSRQVAADIHRFGPNRVKAVHKVAAIPAYRKRCIRHGSNERTVNIKSD